MIRVDKYVSDCTALSRRQAGEAIRQRRVTVNGVFEDSPDRKIDGATAEVTLDGAPLVYARFHWYMLNKPEGYVSSTDDPSGPTVLDFLPPEKRAGLFPCGRLDKNTTGLLLLTDDGKTAHGLLSPKKHVEKEYFFTVARPVTREDAEALERGVDIGVCVTKPCRVVLLSDTSGTITLTEGKYHQIKEMFKNRMNKVTSLKRISFGGVKLDGTLPEGGYRALTGEELSVLTRRQEQ